MGPRIFNGTQFNLYDIYKSKNNLIIKEYIKVSKMEREIISKEIGDPINIDRYIPNGHERLYLEIDSLINSLIKLKDDGATHIYVDGESESDSSIVNSIEIQAVLNIIESDESFEERQRKSNEAAENSRRFFEQLERQQYEILKKKFES
jgi:hypothetical protein